MIHHHRTKVQKCPVCHVPSVTFSMTPVSQVNYFVKLNFFLNYTLYNS